MSTSVSTNYRELHGAEIEEVAAQCAEAWKNPEIPSRQYELAVQPELEKYRRGEPVVPFDALVRCLEHLPEELRWPAATLLDVGASAGYYREVLRQNSWHCDYTACDFSPAFKVLAEKLYPLMKFDVADARELPYASGSFDVVLSGCVLLHTLEYEQVIAEAARVAKRFVIFHRTPITTDGPTAFFVKHGYDTPMIEIHFNQDELFSLFAKYGLTCLWTEEVFFDKSAHFGHVDFVCSKDAVIHFPV